MFTYLTLPWLAAASTYINLAVKESDNNVKLIVLDRLDKLRAKHGHILDSLIMDILQVLASPNLEIRRKVVGIVLSLTSSRNVEEVVLFLKKQLQKTQDQPHEKASEYRQLLIQSIHICAIESSEVAASVVHALMDFLGDSNTPSALDVVAFVKEVVEKFPPLRKSIVPRLISTLAEINSGLVYRGVLWIIGEYSEDVPSIVSAFQEFRKLIGEIPILSSEQRFLDETSKEDGEEKEAAPATSGNKPRILADGTYATETAFTSVSNARLEAVRAAAKPPLRSNQISCQPLLSFLQIFSALFLRGDFYIGSILASALTKLVIRCAEISQDKQQVNSLRAEAMLTMVSVIRVGQSQFVIDEDSNERIINCIQTLSDLDKQSAIQEVFLKDTKAAFSKMILSQEVCHLSASSFKAKIYFRFACRKGLQRRKPQRRKLLRQLKRQ